MSLVSQKNHKKSIFLGFRIPLVSFVGPRCEKNHIFCLFNKLNGVLYTIMLQKADITFIIVINLHLYVVPPTYTILFY